MQLRLYQLLGYDNTPHSTSTKGAGSEPGLDCSGADPAEHEKRGWRARGDLNPGLPAPQAGVLSWLDDGPNLRQASYTPRLYTLSATAFAQREPLLDPPQPTRTQKDRNQRNQYAYKQSSEVLTPEGAGVA